MKKKQKAFNDSLIQSYLSRRDLIKLSAMVLTAATLPGTMGCSHYRPKKKDCLLIEDIVQKEIKSQKQIFEPSTLNGISVSNRIFRSATTLGLADESGKPTEELKERYIELAQGGVGAIITGMAGTQQNGKLATNTVLMIDKDDYIEDYRTFTDSVHEYNTPIIMQVGHAGHQTRSAVTGCEKVAPSAMRHSYYNETMPRELTESEIKEIIDNFIRAIERAKNAGFDGVQLHGAHGYLLSSFLSLHTNRRDDRWGGSIENRFRIIKEIYAGARKRVGNYPVMIKINAYDDQRNGMRLDEAIQIATLLQDASCDAIEVSCGGTGEMMISMRGPEFPIDPVLEYSFRYKSKSAVTKTMIRHTAPIFINKYKPLENYNVCASKEIKHNVDIPVIVVGGDKKLNDINQIIAENEADYVAMSRAFIIEPDIVKRFRTGQQASSECISCNYCIACLEGIPAQCHYGSL